MRSRAAGLVACLAAPLACGSSASDASTTGEPGLLVPASPDVTALSRLTNTIPTSIAVGAATGWAFVDTGNPWALLDPGTFPSVSSLSQSGGSIPSIVIASQTAKNVFVFASSSGDLQGDSTLSLDANLGCSVVCGYTPSFNYRDVIFTLSPGPTPSGLEPATTVPFSFEGGGTVDGVSAPTSRIVVTVSVEGNDYSMIVDTGASDVTLSANAYTVLTSDGRAQISGGDAETTAGSSTSSLTRAASISVGGVEVDSLVVAHDTSFDQNLASVSQDVGHTIDGSLGGTFLHDFYVTVDYAQNQLTFARYTDTSFILDAGEHIGITLEVDPAGDYYVDTASGDAASQGVTTGDAIISIDGQVLSSITSLEASTLIFGAVGSTKMVQFGVSTSLTGMTVPILVDETLPLPSP